MKTKLIILTFMCNMIVVNLFAQEFLDIEKNKEAELFVQKKDYDIQKRLEEIKNIVGKQVTVYYVTGKDNKIKSTYTGIAEMSNNTKFDDKSKASLIIVKGKDANGAMRVYFPLTNNKKYRIYLNELMKE